MEDSASHTDGRDPKGEHANLPRPDGRLHIEMEQPVRVAAVLLDFETQPTEPVVFKMTESNDPTVCEYCGTEITEDNQKCPARDEGTCDPSPYTETSERAGPPVCEFCGCYITDDDQVCAARDDGRCLP